MAFCITDCDNRGIKHSCQNFKRGGLVIGNVYKQPGQLTKNRFVAN